MNISDFKVKDRKGEIVSLSAYQGKVLMIVNTAIKCGLTPQYDALEAVYKRYKDRGFEILDFPSNQFLNQAPGSDEDINSFCTLNYGTTFPRFSKVDVNGKNADPLFAWLREEIAEDSGDEESAAFEKKVKPLKPFAKPGDIKWNFGKFLVDKKGNVVKRFSPGYTPEKIESTIEELLSQE
ncbi:glutathione peroxidase [Scatolibacter rhodanostii]|uniref:glutathione peroxidase n=1 Tax=Scatolibacter rhodanostii TaxID=2014781 RepID=UPI000C06C52A|nr:glutathione peroxidase [Scatolibacter rhodanostii]